MMGSGSVNIDFLMFKDILYMSGMRGPHSTGLMTVECQTEESSKNPTIVKETGPVQYFMMMDEAKKKSQIKDYAAHIHLGHCRWSTVGASTKENAHPFDTGRYVSAHNGTLYDSWSYAPKGSDKTDSLLMFEKMETEGVVEVLQGMRETSAYAISMYDKKNRNVILARNKERPLYVAVSKKRDVVWWASEYGILFCGASRNNIEVDIYPTLPGQVYWLNPFKIKKGEKCWGVTKLNPRPTEFSKSKTRKADADSVIDWGVWGVSTDLPWSQETNDEFVSAVSQDDAGYLGNGTFSHIQKGTHQMTDSEWTAYELAKAGRAAITPPLKNIPKKSKSQMRRERTAEREARRLAALKQNDVTALALENRISFIDGLLADVEEVTQQELHEQAQKAIEEAQGVTRTKPAVMTFIGQHNNHPEGDEECCTCQEPLVGKAFMEAEATDIDGTFYYVCKACNEDLANQRSRRA